MSEGTRRQARRDVIAAFADSVSARSLAGASREFRLVAACCRPPSETRARAISAAAEGVDWACVLKLAERHRVFGHLRDGLAQARVAPPPAVAATLATRVAAMTRRNLRLASETARLARAFRDQGIDAVFLKGATLEALAYRSLSIKHSLDIDIFVVPADVGRARTLLEQMDYVGDPPLPPHGGAQIELIAAIGKEWPFRSAANGVSVDLHWRLSDSDRLFGDRLLSSSRRMVAVGGVDTPTFCAGDLFAYLCAHGAQHFWCRLKWLADLAALLAREEADVESLYRAAEAAGAARSAAEALILCETLLALELPQALSARLRGRATLVRLSLSLTAILGGGATDLSGRRIRHLLDLVSLLLPADGPGSRLQELRRHLILPVDVAAVPLPRRMSWLYIALRAPLWLGRRIGARRARKG
jgi:hypothetical protein